MKDKRTVLIGVAMGVILAFSFILMFFIGVWVGKRNENLLPFWGRRYASQDFISRRLEGHGIVGIIDSLGKDTLVIKDRKGELKTILINEKTVVRYGWISLSFSDLKKNEEVIVLGLPEQKEGVIKAGMIRVIKTLK